MKKLQQAVSPALRFKDEQGRDYPEWERRPLAEIGKIIGGGTPSTKNKTYWNGNINWFTPTEIHSKYSKKSVRKITEKGLSQSSAKLLPVGSILFTSRATIGEVSIATEECTTNQGFQSFIVESSFYSNEYAYYWIKNNRNEFLRIASGSTYLEVPRRSIKKILFDAPILEEQQKIGSFLSSVDRKIEQLIKKKDLLEQYKKGMMQKLFGQEIRFKDEQGKEYPEWVEKKLDQIADIVMGTSPKSSAYNNRKIGLPLIQGNADIKNGKSNPKIYTSEITKVCFPNDTLLSVRAPVGEVSKSIHHACIGRGISAIRAKYITSQNFLHYCMIRIEPKWARLSQGSTFKSINTKEVESFSIQVPLKQEQQKIGSFLSAIDRKIELVDEQIKLTQTFKKGLLQQMFV